jgi:type IV pilus assembly protein PilN
MIRINLLPIKQDRRREAGRNQLFIGLAIIAIEIAAFVFLFMDASADVDEQRNANGSVQSEVNRLKAQVKDHKKIIAEIGEFEKRQAAIIGLQDARTGPVYVMLELSNVLSLNGRPHIDNTRYQEMIQIDPASGYDEDWDHRRLWLDEFEEKSREITIKGRALTHEDVAEFLRRLNLSDFFVSNELISTRLEKLSLKLKNTTISKDDPVVKFELKGRLRYR